MKNKIFFYLFISIWGILVVINLIKPTKTFSEQENRMLSKLPKFTFESLVSGDYAKNLEEYLNDQFIFRDQWLKIKSSFEIATGKKENNDVYIGKDGYLFEKDELDNSKIENIELAANKIDTLASKLEIPAYFILIPNSIYINSDKLPNNASIYNQEEIINYMYNIMKNTINIPIVKELKENKNDELYYKTDHHMTSDGSYIVYKKLCQALSITEQTDFIKEKVSDSFLGTFDSKAQIINQKADNIYIYKNFYNTNLEEVIYDNETTKSIYNEEYLDKKDKYSYFLNGNNSKVIIKTKQKNNRKLLIIKDSYAHNMAQFLCGNYEEIHLIDPRYYRLPISEYIEENNITEVLFLYNVQNLLTDLGIRNIM